MKGCKRQALMFSRETYDAIRIFYISRVFRFDFLLDFAVDIICPGSGLVCTKIDTMVQV